MYNVRKANINDLDQVWRLWKQIMDEKVYFPHDESCTRESIEKSWINLENLIFIVELKEEGPELKSGSKNLPEYPAETPETQIQADRIAGAYILKPNQPGYGKHIANASYMVSSSHRGKGLGKLLCAHSLDAARNAGYRGIQFNLVVSTNIEAVRAWQANGFEIIGIIPGGFYHVDKGYVDAYIFFKDLTME